MRHVNPASTKLLLVYLCALWGEGKRWRMFVYVSEKGVCGVVCLCWEEDGWVMFVCAYEREEVRVRFMCW